MCIQSLPNYKKSGICTKEFDTGFGVYCELSFVKWLYVALIFVEARLRIEQYTK